MNFFIKKDYKKIILLLIIYFFISQVIGQEKKKKTIILNNKNDLIHAFVIPHSHDDVGWLLTIEEYYEIYVQHIYNQIVESLTNYPSRRFIVVEIAYFSKWWEETATLEQKEKFKKLVLNKQIEFVVGGWTMEDEGCTTYSTNIDQMTKGHQYIYNLFGVRPRFGWQIDPFGASNVVHEHFALMGFDATVIDRIDYQLKDFWQKKKHLQFVWEPSFSYGNNLQIFTHVMDQYLYSTATSGFYWEQGDLPVTFINIEELSNKFVKNIKERNNWYKSNIVLFTWGTDFDHYFATYGFENMDKIINYVNEHKNTYGVDVRYSTLGEYFDTLYEKNLTWEIIKNQDFFPYIQEYDKYWSGYFTSRVALKGFIRHCENILRTAEIIHSLDTINCGNQKYIDDSINRLDKLRKASAEATHHDAVSGTSESWVVKMYANHLLEGIKQVIPVIEKGIQNLAKNLEGNIPLLSIESLMELLNENTTIPIILFNPLAWKVKKFISIPVFRNDLMVTDFNQKTIFYQVNPSRVSYSTPCLSPGTCGSSSNNAPFELFFFVELPPIGYSTYFISISSKKLIHGKYYVSNEKEFFFKNNFLQLTFSNQTGYLMNIHNIHRNLSMNIKQNFYIYTGSPKMWNVSEGAYVFHPLGPAKILEKNLISFEIIKGPYIDEIRQIFTKPCNWTIEYSCGVSQIYRIYHAEGVEEVENFVEVLNSVGPISIETDFVTRFSTSLQNDGIFFTDENCFEIQKRKFDSSKVDPIAGNYYPITCASYLRDQKQQTQFTILTDRTHGGSSLNNGELEIMIHRRSISSDYGGPLILDDTDHIENLQFLLLFDDLNSSSILQHKLQYVQQFPPTILYSVMQKNSIWNFKKTYSLLQKEFPPNIHLLTFQFLTNNTTNLLFRLTNIFEKNDPSTFSNSINLNNFFINPKINKIEEYSLTGIWPIHEMKRKKWKTIPIYNASSYISTLKLTNISLNPIEIRTFYLQFQKKNC